MEIFHLSNFKNIKNVKVQGSGKVFTGVLNGEKYYIKEVLKYMPWNAHVNIYGVYDYELVLNEVLASKIYNDIYHIPAVELYIIYNDTERKMQRFLIASKAVVIDSCQKPTRDCRKLYSNKFDYTVEPFLVDCILANWDVAADGNIGVVTKENKRIAFRLDVGGSLKFRALGAPRAYQANPIEHISMLMPENISSTLFVSITKKQVNDMFTILSNADLSKLNGLKRNMLKEMKKLGLLTSMDIEILKNVFDTMPILKKRHIYYLKHKQQIEASILHK